MSAPAEGREGPWSGAAPTPWWRAARDVSRGAWRGVVWYARELAGETRWDRYLEHCREQGHDPVSRRAFERDRSDVLERTPQSRCC